MQTFQPSLEEEDFRIARELIFFTAFEPYQLS